VDALIFVVTKIVGAVADLGIGTHELSKNVIVMICSAQILRMKSESLTLSRPRGFGSTATR